MAYANDFRLSFYCFSLVWVEMKIKICIGLLEIELGISCDAKNTQDFRINPSFFLLTSSEMNPITCLMYLYGKSVCFQFITHIGCKLMTLVMTLSRFSI